MKKVLFILLIAATVAVGIGHFIWWPESSDVLVAEMAMFSIFSPVVLKRLPENTVKTPCNIVYMLTEDGVAKLYELPYLDFSRRDDVWGIAVNGVWVQATDAPETSLAAAMDYAEKTSGGYAHRIGLPSVWQAMAIMLGCKKFERTVQILTQFSVEAENFVYGNYWCEGEKRAVVCFNGKKDRKGKSLLDPFRHARSTNDSNHVRLVVK